MKEKRVCLGAVLMLCLTLAGCVAPMPRVHEAFVQHPEKYQQLGVTPIVFKGMGNLDKSLTLADLQTLSRPLGSNVLDSLRHALLAKRYSPSTEVRVLALDES